METNHMKLSEKHRSLVQELGELKVSFQAVAARVGGAGEAQKEIDRIGIRLIALEQESGVSDARHLLAHTTVTDDLPMFEEAVERYSRLLEEAKKSVATLTRIRNEAAARRKKIPAEVLAIASEPDPLSQYERENFERHYLNTRAERASNSVVEKIFKPLEPATV